MGGAGDHSHDDEVIPKVIPAVINAVVSNTVEKEEKEFNLKGFKIGMIFVILICGMFGGLVKACPAIGKNELVLSLMNCYSAGLFLNLALLHIIPEGNEVYEGWVHRKELHKAFPLDYVMVFVGYMLVLAVDRVLASYVKKLTKTENLGGHSHGPT